MEDSYQIDKESGIYYWIKSIDKEMKTEKVIFDCKEEGNFAPMGY